METSPTKKRLWLLWLGIASLILAPLLILAAIFLTDDPSTRQGLYLISLSCGLAGIGEILNHPSQTSYSYGQDEELHLQKKHHHGRNSCALGNLFDIFAILLFFLGLANFF